MKKNIFAAMVLMLSGAFAMATHNVTGYISYSHVSGYTYELKVTIITEIGNNNADRPEIGIHISDGFFDSIPRTSKKILDGGKLQVNTYERMYTFSGPGWYEIGVSDPNRSAGLLNINNSIETQFHLSTTLIIGSFQSNNNSPIPSSPLIFNVEANSGAEIQVNCWDVDGDYLSYELIDARSDFWVDIPNSIPQNATIDPFTGKIEWSPIAAGNWVFTVLVTECRDNHEIGTSIIEYAAFASPSGVSGQFDSTATLPLDSNGRRIIIVSPGDTLSMDVYYDYDGDTAKVKAYSDIKEKIFTKTSLGSLVETKVLWKTKADHKRCAPYFFSIRGFGSDSVVSDLGYTVYVKNSNECADECLRIYTDVTEIEEEARAESHVFPNPVRSELTINSQYNTNFEVYNIDGKKMVEGNLDAQTYLDVSNWPSGTYIIRSIAEGKDGWNEIFIKE